MVYLPMKRGREGEMEHLATMANYLMLLSKGTNYSFDSTIYNDNSSPARVFECKTCNRQFPSFQALGGHRASHKKPRLVVEGDTTSSHQIDSAPAKRKTHECSICGLEFAIGQALGGHMRRHRTSAMNENQVDHHDHLIPLPQVPVLKRANSGRRVFGLDLNLTPLENDLEFRVAGKVAPLVELCL